jgi:hypothetical protein
MVPSHRRALRARLLSFQYVDGIYLRRISPRRDEEGIKHKVMAGGTPANPATMALNSVLKEGV